MSTAGIVRGVEFLGGAVLFKALGPDRFHLMSQSGGLSARLCRAFVGAPGLHWAVNVHRHMLADVQGNGRSAGSRIEYSGDDLGGWANRDQVRGDSHLPLRDQLRGLVLPTVEQSIADGAKTVVEIGCSTGEVVAHLAEKFPSVNFVGVDLPSNLPRQTRTNLSFLDGYALDMLERGKLRGDVLFASSTFCVFPPPEMKRYAAAIAKAGFRTVIIHDPMRKEAYSPERYPGRSMHLQLGQWGHDFASYFSPHWFSTTWREFPIYTKHRVNPRIRRQLIRLDRVA
jgi:hypothetical protein